MAFRGSVVGEVIESVNREYFDRVYRESEDPWHFESSEYERDKYEASLRVLPKQSYTNVLEIGCSIGVFTAALAPRCDRLLSIDFAPTAVERARQRCRAFPHVSFKVMSVPEEYPAGDFDLTILSEVGYYLRPEELVKLGEGITAQALPGGHLLLVHWLSAVPNYPLRGDDVHGHFLRLSGWHPISSSRSDLYRIDVLERDVHSDDLT